MPDHDFIVDGTIKVYTRGEHGDRVTRVTVSDCIDCGCLVLGRPTKCIRCVNEPKTLWSRLRWLLRGK